MQHRLAKQLSLSALDPLSQEAGNLALFSIGDQNILITSAKRIVEGSLGAHKAQRDALAELFAQAFRRSGLTGEELVLWALNNELVDSAYRVRFGLWIDDKIGDHARAIEIMDMRTGQVTDRMNFAVSL